MIFVTVGTEQFPFDRLLKAVEQGIRNKEIEHEVFAQTGNCLFKPTLFNHEKFITYNEMNRLIRESDIVVSHAGEGTTLLCLSLGKIPILMPRQDIYKEHVDNHQVELARRMSKLGKALVADSDSELIHAVRNYNILIGQLNPDNSESYKKRLVHCLATICKSAR